MVRVQREVMMREAGGLRGQMRTAWWGKIGFTIGGGKRRWARGGAAGRGSVV